MSKIDLDQVFAAVVTQYDLISHRIPNGEIDGEKLIRAAIDRPKKMFHAYDLAANHQNGRLSYNETHCLSTAWTSIRNFDDMRPHITRAEIEERMDWHARLPYDSTQAQALSSYLAVAGFRMAAHNLGYDDIHLPDLAKLEQKLGLTAA